MEKITRLTKITFVMVLSFLFFWFANVGFSLNILWQIIQSAIFAIVFVEIFFIKQIKNSNWFVMVISTVLLSAILEAAEFAEYSIIAMSVGFGVLTIWTINEAFKLVKSVDKNDK